MCGVEIMTIAISIKVNDGVVLAADSASTMYGKDAQGNTGIFNVYDNANKVANLHKDIPVGIITWGTGSIVVSTEKIMALRISLPNLKNSFIMTFI